MHIFPSFKWVLKFDLHLLYKLIKKPVSGWSGLDYTALQWLYNDLKIHSQATTKTLVYIFNEAHIITLMNYFNGLGKKALYQPGRVGDSTASYLQAYYADAGPNTKQYILKEVMKVDSVIRVVFGTVAFGMGRKKRPFVMYSGTCPLRPPYRFTNMWSCMKACLKLKVDIKGK